MNERILEAAFQAEFINKLVRDDSYFIDNPKLMAKLDKFAKLIVKECTQVLLANKTPLAKDYEGEWYDGYNCAMNNSIYYIHEHFGVEE